MKKKLASAVTTAVDNPKTTAGAIRNNNNSFQVLARNFIIVVINEILYRIGEPS